MKMRSVLLAFAVVGVLGSTETLAQNAEIANSGLNDVSAITRQGIATGDELPSDLEPS
jgi:hypothetical protein